MKKVDIYQILFGLLLTVIALFFIFRASAAHSQGKPKTSMQVVKVGELTWDLTETTIAEVKTFADATGFISQAELNGGGLSYESGFVKKPGWTWRSPYGVDAKDQEPAVHLTQNEAQSVCRFYGKRLPSNSEWVEAAFLEQRATTPPGFTRGERYLFPGGKDAVVSHCLNGCGNYQGLAPSGTLSRGTGHVLAGATKPGVNGLYDMGGNVWEWTATESNGGYITRGASWWYGPERQKESDLRSRSGDIAVVYIGFRCVT